MQKSKIHYLNLILYFTLSITILIGFYFGEDSSGSGGFVADFYSTWPLVDIINQGEYYDFSKYTIHFPLHYYILYCLSLITDNQNLVRLIFSLISLIVPYLFFLILREKFSKIDINKLFFFSLLIFLLPSFRSGAIWANAQITGLIFFMISLIYYLRWINIKQNYFNKEIFLQCFFLSLAVYSRQLYALIFLYILYIYFLNLKFDQFLKTSLLIFIFSIPGIFIVFSVPSTLTTSFDLNFFNSFIVNTSIIGFYLIPIFFLYFFDNLKKIQVEIFEKKNILIFFISTIIFIFSLTRFNYNPSLGGGFFIKLSILIFDNLYFFYLSSIISIFLILYLVQSDKKSIFLFFLLIFGFSSYQIFQKYFEPMFLILLFSVINFEYLKNILKSYRNIFLLNLYFFIYLFSAILNNIYKITKNFV